MHTTPDPEDAATHLWGLGSERIALGSSTLTMRASAPDLLLATYLHGISATGADALDADLEVAAGHGCRKVVLERRTPAWVEAHLLLRGWATEAELRLELPAAASLHGEPRDHEVLPASGVDADWQHRGDMLRTDHLEEDARHGVPARPAAQTAAIVAHRRAIEQQAPYLCAVRDGVPIGFLCTWVSPAGTGVIEDVFVHPSHRGEGIASTMLQHAVSTLRDRGAATITIAAEIGDTPATRYARLGFVPHHVVRSCVLEATQPPRPSTGR